MKGKIAFVLTLVSAANMLCVSALSEDRINVYLKGSRINIYEQEPVIENGRVLVPCDRVLTEMGFGVDWEAESKTVTVSNGDRTVKLTVGSDVMTIDDDMQVSLDTAPKIINGRTMIPIRAVSEGFDAEVSWNSDNKSVIIEPYYDTNRSAVSGKTISKSFKSEDGKTLAVVARYPVVSGLGAGDSEINDSVKKKTEEIINDAREKWIDYCSKNPEEVDDISACEIKYTNTFTDGEFFAFSFVTEIEYQFFMFRKSYKQSCIYELKTGEELTFEQYAGDDFEIIQKLAKDGIMQIIEERDYNVDPYFVDMNMAGVDIGDFGYSYYFQTDYPYIGTGSYVYTVTREDVKKYKENARKKDDNAAKGENSVTYTDEEDIKEIFSDDGTSVCYARVKLPNFESKNKEFALDKINSDVQSFANKLQEDFLSEYGDEAEEFYVDFYLENEDELIGGFIGWGRDAVGEVTYLDNNMACVLVSCVDYVGGAHPSTAKASLIYDIKTGRRLYLVDIAEDAEDVLEKAKKGFEDMIEDKSQGFFESFKAEDLDFADAGYYISDEGITFFFEPYYMALYARGFVEYTVENF